MASDTHFGFLREQEAIITYEQFAGFVFDLIDREFVVLRDDVYSDLGRDLRSNRIYLNSRTSLEQELRRQERRESYVLSFRFHNQESHGPENGLGKFAEEVFMASGEISLEDRYCSPITIYSMEMYAYQDQKPDAGKFSRVIFAIFATGRTDEATIGKKIRNKPTASALRQCLESSFGAPFGWDENFWGTL